MSDTETTIMITPSEVIEHIYCPRFTYYMNVLNIPQFEDRRFKVLKAAKFTNAGNKRIDFIYARKSALLTATSMCTWHRPALACAGL